MKNLLFSFLNLTLVFLHSCQADPGKSSACDSGKKNLIDSADGKSKIISSRIDTSKKDSIIPRKEVPLKDGIGCYYLLDNKENSLEDTSGLAGWEENLLSDIEHYGFGGNIFSHSGGGPNGSEWNANAGDVMIVLASDYAFKNPQFFVSLNGKEYFPKKISWKKSKLKKGSLAWFVLPAADWYPKLRSIKKTDYKILYSDSMYSKKYYMAPLNTGKVVEINFSVSCTVPAANPGLIGSGYSVLQQGYIHNAEGE